MYWPIGAPRVYALSKQETSKQKATPSEDGAETRPENSVPESAEISEQESEKLKEGAKSAPAPSEDAVTSGSPQNSRAQENVIVAARVSRGGGIFATITASTLTVWQTKPTVALASVIRSAQSMKAYGPNTSLLLRSDSLLIVVQTAQGYLITYTLATDPNARVYQTDVPTSGRTVRKDSIDGYSSYRRKGSMAIEVGPAEGDGIKEVNIRFRMAIRIDAGVARTMALDDELVVATVKPAALQCIRWPVSSDVSKPASGQTQTSTELLSNVAWLAEGCTVVEMIHDRPMNLSCWVSSDGRAYAVLRRSASNVDMDHPASLFQGYCFREPDPQREGTEAVKAAINPRFSLVAVGCCNGEIDVYLVKNYLGNIPYSHKMQSTVSSAVSGKLNVLSYSPDGYALFAGYENGWVIWSVYGKIVASAFGAQDRALTEANDEQWLQGIKDCFWIGGGCDLVLLGNKDDRLWTLDITRSAVTGCFSSANVYRGLLFSSNSIKMYKGHELPDLTALPSDMSLWQNVQVPAAYLLYQWPIKSAVVSHDGKYIAVAGKKGLAHYSSVSGRWRTFEGPAAEYEFSVRGGMCWYQHFLIACIETSEGKRSQVRIFDRAKPLEYSNVLHIEELSAAAIFTTISGSDSLLVYTYENTLLHFIIVLNTGPSGIKLVQVGQIGFHGIIRAPPRVRAISWILPEDQIEHGDPSQDVATASVLFLVDGKLVLLQPNTNDLGELKYDMRVIAQNVEYYHLLRDQPVPLLMTEGNSDMPADGLPLDGPLGHSLRDSLWYFDGNDIHVWSDVQDVLACAPAELGRDLPPTVRVPVDFYPTSVMVAKGIINGLESDLAQRRDINFSFFRLSPRTTLFLPQLLEYHLSEFNSPAALHLSHSYQHLPYFSHALEVLLHDILDSEVDNPPSPPETALLPSAIAFLSSFPAYLDIVANCTRKTELRSWKTLFSHLPPVLDLFEQSLALGKLKTAAGYLLVLHTFEERQDESSFQVYEFARLLRSAAGSQEWELCRELARFLVGIDESGETLKTALEVARLDKPEDGSLDALSTNGREVHVGFQPRKESLGALRNGGPVDYFSLQATADGEDEGFTTPGD